ncbi:MAG: serine hydrolase [bacterium]
MCKKNILWFVLLISVTEVPAQPEQLRLLHEKTADELRNAVQNVRGVPGFRAFDLVRGERFGMNDTLVFPQASAIKIPILMEVFKQEHERKLSFREMMWVEKKKQVGGSGILGELGDHTSQLSVYDLCVLMIVLSDNTATNMLIERVGMDNVNVTLTSLGLKKTKLQRKMLDQSASARGDENLSTPAEAARIMEILYRGEFIDRTVCEGILALLKKGKPEVGVVPGGIPEGIPVAYKSGDLAGVNTEWAIVYLPDLPYVLVMMESFGLGDEAMSSMRNISRILYDYYSRLEHATKYGTYVLPPPGK